MEVLGLGLYGIEEGRAFRVSAPQETHNSLEIIVFANKLFKSIENFGNNLLMVAELSSLLMRVLSRVYTIEKGTQLADNFTIPYFYINVIRHIRINARRV